MTFLFLFHHVLLCMGGVSRVLFLLSDTPLIVQVIFICIAEQVFIPPSGFSKKLLYQVDY